MGKNREKNSYIVKGMDCHSCKTKIENAISNVEGTSNVKVNYTAEKLSFEIDKEKTSSSKIEEIVKKLGYEIFTEDSNEDIKDLKWWQSKHGVFTLFSVFLLLVAFIIKYITPNLANLAFSFVALVAIIPIAKKMFANIGVKNFFSIEMLVVIAVAGAIIINEAAEASIVVILFLIGELLENIAAEKARAGVKALAKLVPETAFLLRGKKIEEVPATSLKIDDIVEVRAGGRIPADGIIIEGSTNIDESMITGESIPVQRNLDDNVFAGSLNVDGVIKVKVTKEANDNMLAKIMHLVEEAETSKAPTARFIDNFSKYYTPLIIILAIFVAVIPPLFFAGNWNDWIYKGLAILLIGCPCALVLSVPAAVTSGIAAGAKRGLLIKGGAILEKIGKLTAFAFDKTGTLTEGKPKLTDIISFKDGISENKVLSYAASVEASSLHPLAVAIVEKANELGIEIETATEAEALHGKGVKAIVAGREVVICSPRYAKKVSNISVAQLEKIAEFEKLGKTVATVIVDKKILGAIAIRDELREDAKEAMSHLKNMDITAIMLTGDNVRTGTALAEKLGIEVAAELLPEDKVKNLDELKEQHVKGVAMVGDGINDAPALAKADIGIAMGGGTDVALETADAALLRENVVDIPTLVQLSKETLKNIKQNITIALGLKLIFFITTLFGITNLWMAILADTGATVIVTLNALRLLRFKPKF